MRPPSVANKQEQRQQRSISSLLHEKQMHEETMRLIEECQRRCSGRGSVLQSRKEQVSEYHAWSQLFENMMKLKGQYKKRCLGIGIPAKEMKQLLRHREGSLNRGKVPATIKSISGLSVESSGQVVHEGDSCAICLEEIASSGSKVSRMPCDHRFHSPCLVRWLMANHSCPICRYKMPAALPK
ncbi:E3 ubiquitin-protein ligase SIRP1-like [Tripterygium wilfordii]|uniref:E3 ubiquitin-protein ligase SIRP1-like n=1 Tax=Tripterygium wilfordii TaxID=458696 RepID=UPI0018F8488A|nr:E3 ubiquitin-protein ligase SIRP1-like [Tripterygium wilfordii]